MRGSSCKVVAAAMAVGFGLSAANAQSANPACQRLEAQLATVNQGNADPARADQIRRTEDMVNRQQLEVDRLVAQSRRIGCQSSGFFSFFSNPPPQCGALTRQIDQQRLGLDRMRNQLEQLNGGTTERAAQRQALLIALGDNGCGPQYRSAAIAGQQGGFFDRLFGGNSSGAFSPARKNRWAGRSVQSACGPVTDFIFRFPIRPRQIASAMMSRPVSACARQRKSRFTPITTLARK